MNNDDIGILQREDHVWDLYIPTYGYVGTVHADTWEDARQIIIDSWLSKSLPKHEDPFND